MSTPAVTEVPTPQFDPTLDYHALNAMLNLYGEDGEIQFGADHEAARRYFREHVNQNTVFFHDLEEKIDYLVENNYYEKAVFDQYDWDFVKALYKQAYAHKFRFPTFMAAYKYFTTYTLKTNDGKRYLERYEDRVTLVALFLARGDRQLASRLVDDMVLGRFQPATPTFLNAGKAQRGELVSCMLLRTEDNMESIGRNITNALQLSKRGAGVALLLTNLREQGAPIKHIEGQSSGVVPVMKLLEDSFKYSNQLGQRPGAGAVYLHAHHPDIMRFLDTKRENADEATRIKTLSLGVVIPDITFDLAKSNRDMYLFSPYDVERVYGKPFSDISVTEKYDEMVDDPRIRKSKVNAREFFQTIAELQFESGYPYIMFEDTVNRNHALPGRITHSNLCSEIAQASTPSTFTEDGYYDEVGYDISCNLASLNIAKAMDSGDLGQVVDTAMRALTTVTDTSNITAAPTIAAGNDATHAVGLGAMNLHGFLGRERIHYGSPEGLEFVSAYFAAVNFYSLRTSMEIAEETGITFEAFPESSYADGSYFDKYVEKDWRPTTPKVASLFSFELPSPEDWAQLRDAVAEHGIYHGYRAAIAPTGSISYVNHSTSSIHPVVAPIEVRKEGGTSGVGRVVVPQYGLDNENLEYFTDAYELGPQAVIDTYAAAQEHVDQSLSCTLFFKDTATTRDLNKAYIAAWRAGLKTLYYVRIRQTALEGTAAEMCVSCAI